jgi:K+/H+ antiporter YhaU regulatory subunit KhtT
MNILNLLPAYLVVLAVVFVFLPTILGIVARFSLYQHLTNSAKRIRYLLEGKNVERIPHILKKIEQRFQNINPATDEINTTAIVAGKYSQEECKILGISFNCEAIAYFTRILPNLLLSFGLLGTFLGITINLTNLSQTITQVDLTDIGSLVAELNQPLQGMGIAFITSLIAIACSSLLAVINLIWNTNLAKTSLINYLEDYTDNFCLAQLQTVNPLEAAINRFNDNCDQMLSNLGNSLENAITKAFTKIEQSANTFAQAANTLDTTRLPEQLSNATTNLAIAQNNFSQSSLVLQRSTQSFEHSIQGIQKAIRQLAILNDEVSHINLKYNTLVEINKQSKEAEQLGMQNIQEKLTQLVKIMEEKVKFVNN